MPPWALVPYAGGWGFKKNLKTLLADCHCGSGHVEKPLFLGVMILGFQYQLCQLCDFGQVLSLLWFSVIPPVNDLYHLPHEVTMRGP